MHVCIRGRIKELSFSKHYAIKLEHYWSFFPFQDLKATLRKCEHETADMKFLNNEYTHKIRLLEKENKAKTEKIQQLQEKNLQAVVQTPGTAPDYVIHITHCSTLLLLHLLEP